MARFETSHVLHWNKSQTKIFLYFSSCVRKSKSLMKWNYKRFWRNFSQGCISLVSVCYAVLSARQLTVLKIFRFVYSVCWMLSKEQFVLSWWVKSYMCVEFGPMRTHKESVWRAFGIADPNGLCLVNFGGYFLFEYFHHVWPLLLVTSCQGACRRFHWCNFLFWWSELFLWFSLLLCLARGLRSYFLSSWSHGWISSSGLLFHTVWCQFFGLLICVFQFVFDMLFFDSPMYTASQSLQSSL